MAEQLPSTLPRHERNLRALGLLLSHARLLHVDAQAAIRSARALAAEHLVLAAHARAVTAQVQAEWLAQQDRMALAGLPRVPAAPGGTRLRLAGAAHR